MPYMKQNQRSNQRSINRSDKSMTRRDFLDFLVGAVGAVALAGAGIYAKKQFNNMKDEEQNLKKVGEYILKKYGEQKREVNHDHYYAAIAEHAFLDKVSKEHLNAFDDLSRRLGIHPHRVLYTVVSSGISDALTSENPVVELKNVNTTGNPKAKKIRDELIANENLRNIAIKLARVNGAAYRLKTIGRAANIDKESRRTYNMERE